MDFLKDAKCNKISYSPKRQKGEFSMDKNCEVCLCYLQKECDKGKAVCSDYVEVKPIESRHGMESIKNALENPTTATLIDNIIDYVIAQEHTDPSEDFALFKSLLYGVATDKDIAGYVINLHD